MKHWPLFRLSASARLAVGLAAVVVSLVLVVDVAFGVLPDEAGRQRQLRQRVGESLAVQLAALIQAGDDKTLNATLEQVVARNKDVRSVAVRRAQGELQAERGGHARHWVAPETGRSSVDHVRVPLDAKQGHWGDVEIAFATTAPRSLGEWLRQPAVVLLGVLAVGGFVLFYAYLRRALHYLDPSTAVPDRVRKAFDVLTDAVLVLDLKGRIMLANRSFRQLHPDAAGELHGRPISALAWLPVAAGDAAQEAPWDKALREAVPVTGHTLAIAQPHGATAHTIVGCAPILDGGHQVRGCLVTFDDVTAVHRSNEALRRAMVELEGSRADVQAKNAELEQLATRDPLTGCFNRRAFFERAHTMFAAAPRGGSTLCCIMADIDHFKRFNDEQGHAVGDKVIQAVAGTLLRGLRPSDLLCRYGGEEFCLLLPATPLVQANAIAQRLREAVMDDAAARTGVPGLRQVTTSFGLASVALGGASLEQLIEHADGALYRSKQTGRNRVSLWEPEQCSVRAC